jgi:hypothetical protein
MKTSSLVLLTAAAVLAACAAEGPQYGNVVTMPANEAKAASGYPPAGTVWRLDERDLRALSPAPIVEPPPPPRLPPPPRPNDPPVPQPYYGPPYYGPHWGGPGFHYRGRW